MYTVLCTQAELTGRIEEREPATSSCRSADFGVCESAAPRSVPPCVWYSSCYFYAVAEWVSGSACSATARDQAANELGAAATRPTRSDARANQSRKARKAPANDRPRRYGSCLLCAQSDWRGSSDDFRVTYNTEYRRLESRG